MFTVIARGGMMAGWLTLVFYSSSSLMAHDWPRYGHDRALTGRSPLVGDLTEPHVAWSIQLAGTDLQVELEPSSGVSNAVLTSADLSRPNTEAWQAAGPRQLDPDGSGTLRPAVETFHERWARILPDVAGYQRVAWNHTWTDQNVCRLQLFAYDQGFQQPRLVWETDPPEDMIFNPLVVVCDIDRDGVPEICVAAHYRIMIFDGLTGRKESELRYHSSRPYGWFGVADVDGDGEYELVTIGDFQSHLDVIDYDISKPEQERLSVRWRRDIEQNIDQRSKWPQVGPRPLLDVTGDGRLEMVINLFNDQGDGQWHTVVLDTATGATIADLPRRYVQGGADVDAGGRAALFVTSTDGVLVHQMGRIELIELRDGAPTVLWSHRSAAWCVADLPRMDPLWSTTASQGMRHVMLAGEDEPVFYVKSWDTERSDAVALSAWHAVERGELERLWRAEGFPASTEMVPIDTAAPASSAFGVARVRVPVGHVVNVSAEGVRPHVIRDERLGIDPSPPIVAKLSAGSLATVVVEGPGEAILAIAPPTRPEETPRVLWQSPGRGMRDGSRALGLLAADLTGDGGCEVLVADQAPEGFAELVALRGDGSLAWRKPFPHIPGAKPVWNIGALTFWWVGSFRDPPRQDLLVNVRRGLMHSDMGIMLDGRDGTTLWTQDKAIVPDVFHWGWGGAPVAVADMNADGRDNIICLHPVCFWVADGRDGQIVTGVELASRASLPAWAAYGEPMVHDFTGDGQPDVLLDSPYVLALLDARGRVLWHGPPRIDYPVTLGEGDAGETTPCKHALVDFNGDGVMEIASAGYGDGVRAIDPAHGTVLWSLAAPAPTVGRAIAANIDGRAGDELLYVAGRQLIAITGDRVAGRILWTWTAPAALGMPVIADLDGTGQARILVQDVDGTVYCL